METHAVEPAEKQREGNYHERSFAKDKGCACSAATSVASPTSHAERDWISTSSSSGVSTNSDSSESDDPEQYEDGQFCTGVAQMWSMAHCNGMGYMTPPPMTKRKRVSCPPAAPRKRRSVPRLPPTQHLSFFTPPDIEVFFAAHASAC
ncbi:hypothetical protein GOP47_0018229 [Adiantum capillus-veneris]|uniref:Uncharacterized protein n=1 Tax=Adiantum capillus-veneris TaxID=13818 RepID=A0A9D4UGX1_ADICA|nr:hypothetical protein GOP47_0018229 [Adiantum capillus-veneris]